MFSPKTEEMLRKAGWSETRKFDTTEYERILSKEGYPVHAVLQEFLRSYGGLYFRYMLGGWEEDFHFDVELAVGHQFTHNVAFYSTCVGHMLAPCGEKHRGHLTLAMTETGTVYSFCEDDDVYLVGASGEEAVEALCTGQYPETKRC